MTSLLQSEKQSYVRQVEASMAQMNRHDIRKIRDFCEKLLKDKKKVKEKEQQKKRDFEETYL